MFTKTLLALGVVVAMSFSATGAYAQNNGYRNDHREMRQDRREFRHERGGRGEHRGFEHHRSNGHSFGGHHGRR